MSTGREIRNKIGSIKKTQKITRAMQLVAASKMRKTQERMMKSRPYAEKMRAVIEHVALSHSEYHHPYFSMRESIKRVGFIVVSTDRGLCGSLNVNLLRTVVGEMKAWKEKGVDSDLCLIGSKSEGFFKRFGANILANANHLGDTPSLTDLIGVVGVMLKAYDEQKLDALYIGYNKFVSAMVQTPTIERLLPLKLPEEKSEVLPYWDYIYEPEAKELLDMLLVRYIESQVYQAVVENIGCEQAARMVAMQSATDNAGELIDELQLAYNKSRQALITREISEIIGGAEAL